MNRYLIAVLAVTGSAITREGFTGTGLGLAIVARAVERMGGRYGVVSDNSDGSEFWIELPAGPDRVESRESRAES